MDDFDVIIVGSGPAGMFCAYELVTRKPNSKVLIIEQGKRLMQRVCPMQKGAEKCLKCKVCAITHGSSGAGAFSDGKLLLPHKSERTVRGNLGCHMNLTESMELYNYTDSVYLQFGATTKVQGEDGLNFINDKLKTDLSSADLNAKCSRIRHLGTDGARTVYQNLEKWLEEHNVTIWFDTEVTDLLVKNKKVYGVRYSKQKKIKEIKSNTVVLAIGRSGTEWLEKMCKKHKILYNFGSADLGVRYELPDAVMKDINENLYEGKFIGYPEPYKDKVRTFCQNPSGLVSAESYKGEMTLVNGHSLLKASSENTNLALLVSISQVKNPLEMTKSIAKNINHIGGGQPVVQRLEDLRHGKKTTAEQLLCNPVIPTLAAATPGDISIGMPHRIVMDILGFIDKMDIVAPGFANDDNLLYAPEIKFYSLILKLSQNCETSIQGLYGIGDGSGPTHGLMPASANGVCLGRILTKKIS